MQLQEKQHAHEKEMQMQKLRQENLLQLDVNVVHLQKDLQDEELQDVLQDEELQDVLQVEELQDVLHEDLVHEEGDVKLLSFFLFSRLIMMILYRLEPIVHVPYTHHIQVLDF